LTTEELALRGVCAAPDAAVAVLSPLVAQAVHRTVAKPPRATDYDDLIQEGLLHALPEVEKVTPKTGEDLDEFMRRFHRRVYLVVSHRMIDLLRHEARRYRQKVGAVWIAIDVMSLEHAQEAGIDIRDPTADVDLVADQELIQELSERYRAVACAAWRSLSGLARRWLALLLLPDTEGRRVRRIGLEQDPSFEMARAQVQAAYGQAMTRLFRGEIIAPSRRRPDRRRPAVHMAVEAADALDPGTVEEQFIPETPDAWDSLYLRRPRNHVRFPAARKRVRKIRRILTIRREIVWPGVTHPAV
jgi:hypothetical protein